MTSLIDDKIRKILVSEFGKKEAIESFSEPFKQQSLNVTCGNNEIYVSDAQGTYSVCISLNRNTILWETANQNTLPEIVTDFIECMNQIADENWQESYEDLTSMGSTDKARYMNKYSKHFTTAENVLYKKHSI